MKVTRLLQFLILGPVLVSLVIIAEVAVETRMDRMLGFPSFSYVFVNGLLASLLLVGGLTLAAISGLLLLRGGRGVPYGDVVKSMQTTQLVKTGPYRFTRNPMILGYALILSSVGLYLGSVAGTLVVPVIALLLLSGWIKLVEEGGLERRFGEEYRRYRQTVPFLFPTRRRRRQE